MGARDIGMEFRVLNRISLHADHASNLELSQEQSLKQQNKHSAVLPFRHSMVSVSNPHSHNQPPQGPPSEEDLALRYTNANFVDGLI